MSEIDEAVRRYMSKIGRKGGRKSRRSLDSDTAREMVRIREARRAYERFHASCFRSHPPDLEIGLDDVSWVAQQLMKKGGREAWRAGRSLCP